MSLKSLIRKPNESPKKLLASAAGLFTWGLVSLAQTIAGPDNQAAGLRLHPLFNHNMVLQRERDVPIWGWTKPGNTVKLALAGREAEAKAGADGKWEARIGPFEAGGPFELVVVSGADKLVISNVVFGEVWLCSGQSNMAMRLGGCSNGPSEIAAADFPMLRQLTIPRMFSISPTNSVTGAGTPSAPAWTPCTPKTAAQFSGVGYFFAREIHRQLGFPVGIINSSRGATRIEAWTGREALETLPETRDLIRKFDATLANLPALEADYAEKTKARKQAMDVMKQAAANAATIKRMCAADLDTNAWKTMNLPSPWEKAGLPDTDGLMWFRKTVDLPAPWVGKDLILNLGPIDEIDTTWFNGVKVGGLGSLEPFNANYWTMPREYKVPGSLVKAGTNLIAVQVIDTSGEGGLWGSDAHTMRLLPDGPEKGRQPVALAGPWLYFVELTLPAAPPKPLGFNSPAVLFNAMINPLIPYVLAGALWYQGESNGDKGYQYRKIFPAMITDWRRRWGQGDFPFFFVQLAAHRQALKQPNPSGWAELREAQFMTLALTNTAMAVALDIGDAVDIHPKNKQDVGKRLALAALATVYGKKDLVYSGPLYTGCSLEDGKIRLRFKHVGGGLIAGGDGILKRFEIAGEDRLFVWAEAKIDGETVVVWNDTVKKPIAVRYAWADNPEGANLYNREGLPASSFRTDDQLVGSNDQKK